MKDNIKREYEGMTKINLKEKNRHTIQKFAIKSSAVQVKNIQKSEIKITDNIKKITDNIKKSTFSLHLSMKSSNYISQNNVRYLQVVRTPRGKKLQPSQLQFRNIENRL